VTVLQQFVHARRGCVTTQAFFRAYLGGMNVSFSPLRIASSFAVACVLASGLMSCGGSEAPPSPQEVAPVTKLSPAARENLNQRQDEKLRLHELAKVQVENTLSPYRYVTSTAQYSIFGSLLKASTHSRVAHSQGVTLLAPTDAAFDAFDSWKMLTRTGSQGDLDEFIAHHIVPGIMSYEEFKSADAHETLAGEAHEVRTSGGIYFNDAHVRSGHVGTENGTVIGLDDVVFIPLGLR
jgi:uncharacterized surface protein with fasciclin (FAS1) repeats